MRMLDLSDSYLRRNKNILYWMGPILWPVFIEDILLCLSLNLEYSFDFFFKACDKTYIRKLYGSRGVFLHQKTCFYFYKIFCWKQVLGQYMLFYRTNHSQPMYLLKYFGVLGNPDSGPKTENRSYYLAQQSRVNHWTHWVESLLETNLAGRKFVCPRLEASLWPWCWTGG